ncbi:MAG: GntR family transcriptional regulator [bacterium]|nr:GntR family transcriptional regulator [bacterium]
MRFEIDPAAPTPPSEQLADQVRFAVAAGRLEVGERLPSVRDVAASVRVNPNTVSRAWRELEREGTVRARRGAGVFVADEAPLVCRALRAQLVSERIARVVREALGAGLEPTAIVDLVLEAAERWRAERAADEEEAA